MTQAWISVIGQRLKIWGWTMALAAMLPAAEAAVTVPRVGFDAAGAVECRDVTTCEFSALNPNEKVIEARFRISILFEEGKQEHLEDVMVVIESPEKRLRVTDFSPKTELGTDVSGPINATDTADHTNTAGANVGVNGVGHIGVGNAQITDTNRHVANRVYKQLPAKYLVLASGTTLGEHGVFFKIKASPQTSLEGAKEFTCWFVVPKSWRGDWCLLSCKARAYRKNYLVSKLEMCGQADVMVGLYLAGDEQGKALARRLDRMQMTAQYSPQMAAAQAQLSGAALSMSTVASIEYAAKPSPLSVWFSSLTHPGRAHTAAPRPRRSMQDALTGLSGLSGGR